MFDIGIPEVLIIAALLAIFVFELAMFIDVATNQAIDKTRKVSWIIGMILVHPFVAIAYFFTDHKKRKK